MLLVSVPVVLMLELLGLPAAMLLAVVFLVGGQTLLERVLQLNTTVSVVIEFLGGIVFLTLILRRGRR